MEELIIMAQNGDENSFTEIIILINDDLYKIARARVSNEDDIEDAIQETMLEAYKSIKKLKNPSKFKKWIIKILINKCNRIYRRKYKKDVPIDEYTEVFENEKSKEISELENNLNFYDIIKILNYEERIIMILYYMEEYTVREIKEILHMNINTINTVLFRARQKLRNTYDKRNP